MNAIAMIRRSALAQWPKFDGPACEGCALAPATEQLGQAKLCNECARRLLLAKLGGGLSA